MKTISNLFLTIFMLKFCLIVQSNEVSESDLVEAVDVLIVVGAGGGEPFQAEFDEAAKLWTQASQNANLSYRVIGLASMDQTAADGSITDRQRLLDSLTQWQHSKSMATRWLIFIGHGTATKSAANFNLNGPDISKTAIVEGLKECKCEIVVACGFSTSGVWLSDLSGPNRIVMTATKQTSEINYSRFAKYLAESIADPQADLDHDEEVSLLEAFLAADHRTQQFYIEQNRLASEHALLDDNGDKQGTPGTFYDGLNIVGKSIGETKVDGQKSRSIAFLPNNITNQLTSEQITQRGKLEEDIRELKNKKSGMEETVYYDALEQLLLKLAGLYHQ